MNHTRLRSKFHHIIWKHWASFFENRNWKLASWFGSHTILFLQTKRYGFWCTRQRHHENKVYWDTESLSWYVWCWWEKILPTSFFRAISNESIFANSSLAPHPYYFHSRQLTNDITTSYRAMDIQTISSPLPSVPTKDLSCDGNSIGSSHQKLSLGSASKKIRCVEHTSSIDCDHRQLHHFISNLIIFTARQSPRKRGSLWEQLRRRQEK